VQPDEEKFERASWESEDDDVGIVCAVCGCRDFKVVYARPTTMKRIRRRRQCRHCGYRFTTYESIPD
jgi:hypothetical protein